MLSLAFVACATLFGAAPIAALAQDRYPSRPVKIVVPFGAGTGLDVVARGFAERLGEQMKGTFIVENREGAGGTIGALAVAKAPADGYTLVFTAHPPFAIGPALQASASYDPPTDFAPITKVATIPMVLIASTAAPFKTFGEMAAYAKANPGKLDYASSGIGTPSHLNVEVIKHTLGLSINPVPYKSTGQAMSDTLGGQVPLYMPSFPAALANLQAGRVRGLAIGSAKRASAFPDMPTVGEVLKRPGLEAAVWYGFLAPKGTPAALIAHLNTEIQNALGTPEITKLLANVGAEKSLLGPQEFAAAIRTETEEGRKLLQTLGVKPGQ